MPLHLSLEETIAAPPERVFAALTDLEAAKAWMPNLVRIEKLGDAHGVGMQFRETRKMFGREATEHFEVTRFEPNQAVELYVDGTKGSSRKGFYRFRYDLEPRGGGTLVRMHGEIGGMGAVAEFLGKLFMGPFKKAIRGDLVAMKRWLDTNAS